MSRASDTAVHWYISTSISTPVHRYTSTPVHQTTTHTHIHKHTNTQPRATALHMYWVAGFYYPAVPYAYMLGRGAV